MKVWRDQLSFWLMSAAMMGLLIALQVSLKPWQETDKKLERLLYLPDAEYLKIASLGYRELLADLLWIQSIQIMGEKKVSESSGRWLYRALDIITTLDSKFVRAYEAGGLALTTLVVLPLESNQLMMKGMQHNPTEWKLPFLIGINYYYESTTTPKPPSTYRRHHACGVPLQASRRSPPTCMSPATHRNTRSISWRRSTKRRQTKVQKSCWRPVSRSSSLNGIYTFSSKPSIGTENRMDSILPGSKP